MFRIAYCTLALVLAGCAILPISARAIDPAERPSAHIMEAGIIEGIQRVAGDEKGAKPYGSASLLIGIHEPPSQEEIEHKMISAATDMLSIGLGPGAHVKGTSYMVRLACGGLIYVFEPGPQMLDLGVQVNVEHGVSPRIVR